MRERRIQSWRELGVNPPEIRGDEWLAPLMRLKCHPASLALARAVIETIVFPAHAADAFWEIHGPDFQGDA